jgi:hypothetical protein
VKDQKRFIKAYHDFKRSIDFNQGGILPELDNLVWFILTGPPEVPADEDRSLDAQVRAIDQRVAILKAVFVEVNGTQRDDFLDRGLMAYDRAGEMAKRLIEFADIGGNLI